MTFGNPSLFEETEGPRGALVRCICGSVHGLYSGQTEPCSCGWSITLEETAGGGFRTKANREDGAPMLKPIPQIVGWLQEEVYQAPKLFE